VGTAEVLNVGAAFLTNDRRGGYGGMAMIAVAGIDMAAWAAGGIRTLGPRKTGSGFGLPIFGR